jgi:GntR family transcriptional regulator/MocR family aminotransferase
MTIPIDLRRNDLHSLQEQIYTQIRRLILSGRLVKCERMPSSREMARDLGVSRNTVLYAYDWLKNEGYLDSKDNTGIFVSGAIPDQFLESVPDGRGAAAFDREPPRRVELKLEVTAPANVHLDRTRPRIDFWYGRFDRRNFPLNTWRRLINENLSRAGSHLSEYGAPSGCHELRKAVSSHLGSTRGMRAPPERIIVTAGAQDGLNLICRLLVQHGKRVAVENPCYGSAALSGAENFPDADFAGAPFRACGSQVHKIDTGDDENDPGDQGKDANVLDPAVGGVLFAVLERRVKAPLAHREQERFHDGPRRLVLDVVRQNFVDGGGVG